VFQVFKRFKAMVEKEIDMPIKFVRFDRVGEFISFEFMK